MTMIDQDESARRRRRRHRRNACEPRFARRPWRSRVWRACTPTTTRLPARPGRRAQHDGAHRRNAQAPIASTSVRERVCLTLQLHDWSDEQRRVIWAVRGCIVACTCGSRCVRVRSFCGRRARPRNKRRARHGRRGQLCTSSSQRVEPIASTSVCERACPRSCVHIVDIIARRARHCVCVFWRACTPAKLRGRLTRRAS